MPNMKTIEFPIVNFDEWKEQAIKALKGRPFESLFTKTLEGITLNPLYTKEMLVEQIGEQLEKQIATVRTMQETNNFQPAQQIFGETADKFFENLQDSVNRGNKVLTIDSRVSFEWDEDQLFKLAQHLTVNSFKLIVKNQNDPILEVFNLIAKEERADVKGYVVSEESITLDEYPNIRTLVANTTPYHYEGANAIQELALVLAIASKLSKQEESFNSFINKFFVNFAVDTQFFSEIAKLRAFRVLWKAFITAYGEEQNIAVPIVAETSLRSFSKLDVYVNLLRAGNEAFAALIGGADVFTVHPHDVLIKPTDKSIRIARNVVLVQKEESNVQNVLDPSGGSYFIESLTAEYVEKAWSLFLEIEDAGGIDQFIQTNKLGSLIEEVNTQRLQSVKTRKHSLIGTNIYADPQDELPSETNPLFSEVNRLAIPFENLRKQYSESKPKIGILTFGKLKDFKPRADFVKGFFATAGIVPSQSGEIETIEAAIEWLNNTDASYVVLAAKDEDTKSIVPALLKAKRNGLLLDVAGKYKEQEAEWKSTGLNGFIFAGQDIVEKLGTLAESLKEVQR